MAGKTSAIEKLIVTLEANTKDFENHFDRVADKIERRLDRIEKRFAAMMTKAKRDKL